MSVKNKFGDELAGPGDPYKESHLCSSVRHWLANHGLCKHSILRVKDYTVDEFADMSYEELEDFPEGVPLKILSETTTVEDYLTLLTRTWDDIISEYELPFRAIMGEEKWSNVCERFRAASNRLKNRNEEEEDDLTDLLDPKYGGVFVKVVDTIREIDEQEEPMNKKEEK